MADAEQNVPRVLGDVHELTGADPGTGSMIAWRLREQARQLDANLVRLAPGEHIGSHIERDLDVLVLIVTGEGVLHTEDGDQPLRSGSLAWLPSGASRGFTADQHGLDYLTVHTRRPGLTIRRPEN